MSATDDINSNKDEDDLLKEDLDNHNIGQVAETSVKHTTEEVDNSVSLNAAMAEATSNTIAEHSGKSEDNVTNILKENAPVDETVAKSPLATINDGSGDCTTATKKTEVLVSAFATGNETIYKDSIAGKPEADAPSGEKTEQLIEKLSNILSEDELDEEDLQLRWDEDDGNDSSLENIENVDIKDNEIGTEILEKSKSENNVASAEIEKTAENIVEGTSEMTLEEINKVKEAEILLEEEKLLEDHNVYNDETDKLQVTDSAMDMNEEDLLKDDTGEDSVMDIDTSNKDIVEKNEATKKKIESIEQQEIPMETETNELNNDEFNCPIEGEKKTDSVESKTDEQKENMEITVEPVIENLPEVKITMEEESNLNVSQVDTVDKSPNTSSIDSPIHIKRDHGLHKPDVMLEIPTQELIDIDDVLDSPDDSKCDDNVLDNSKCDDDNNCNVVKKSVSKEHAKDSTDMDDQSAEIDEADEVGLSGLECANIGEMESSNVEKEMSSSNVLEEGPVAKARPIEEAQPSTSTASMHMTMDPSDDMPDMTDSLGLLAESRRVMGDDDDDDDDDADGDDDDDDDSDLDESSNQMTAEHSEDSNAQHSETDTVRDEPGKGMEFTVEEKDDMFNKCEEDFEYTLNEVGTEKQTEDDGKLDELNSDFNVEELKDKLDKEEKAEKGIKDDDIKTEGVKKEDIKTEGVKKEDIKTEGVKKEDIKTEGVKKEEVKMEGVGGEVEKLKTLLPQIKSVGECGVKLEVKEEKADSVVKKERTGMEIIREKEMALGAVKKTVDRQISDGSNDDVKDITEEIETVTVKLSDDEDEPPSKKDQAAVEEPTAKENYEKDAQMEDKTAEEQAIAKEHYEKDVQMEDEAEDKTAKEQAMATEEPEPTTEEEGKEDKQPSPKRSPCSPSQLIGVTISVDNIVHLEESSSEDDARDPKRSSRLKRLLESDKSTPRGGEVTTVNIPAGIEVSKSGRTSDIVVREGKEGEMVISGVTKPSAHTETLLARLNSSELSIRSSTNPSEQTLVIPEAKMNDKGQPEPKSKPKLSLEIFSLDSDEEDTPVTPVTPAAKAPEPEPPAPKPAPPKKKIRKCINYSCNSTGPLYQADEGIAMYYDASRKRRPMVCEKCAEAFRDRQQSLIDGIKNMTPLLQLDMGSMCQDLVEVLDSDSEDEEPPPEEDKPTIEEIEAEFIDQNLTDLLNDVWKTHNMDDRLKETQDELNAEIEKLEKSSNEINQMLNECQRVTDRLRTDLYRTFQHRIEALPPILIYETPDFNYIGPEIESRLPPDLEFSKGLRNKRKMSAGGDLPPKRPAIPVGVPIAPLDTNQQEPKVEYKTVDDDKDISVVKLTVESAPPDLPPPGELARPPLKVGMTVHARKTIFGAWLKGKIQEIVPKNPNSSFTSCRVKFDNKAKNNGPLISARCIAYAEPASVRLTIGTRLAAVFKGGGRKEAYYSGVVAEVPNPVNNYRYLVFFDDGYAQYVCHRDTLLVCESSQLVWEEVHPDSREFVRNYLLAYPERPMVRLHEGQSIKIEWETKWWPARVMKVDASLAEVLFMSDCRREWIYRGSTRLAPLYLELKAAERHRLRPMPRSKHARSDMPYVEYTRMEVPTPGNTTDVGPSSGPDSPAMASHQKQEESRLGRAVARKSTALPAGPPQPQSLPQESVTSRVVYYTPKNAVKPLKLVPHSCSSKCKRSDVLSLKDLRTYNPLAKPLLSGWERQVVRYKGNREVMYRAPCGRRLRNMRELHRYLRLTDSDLPVDLFDFYHLTHCLAEFVLSKCPVSKKDLSNGRENVPVPCVNYYDESLPEFCSYNTERTPTTGVPLNLDPEFLCGCDCTDDCEDKSKCACWQLTLEGARTIGLAGDNVGYVYKRLPEPLPSGIYECNSRCKCRATCLNRVAQHPLQLKLQVFKTLNRGWGIRALNDVPKGAFLCVYAGNLLTDATANLDGLNEGDEYLAELDYIEVVEQMKEGYEEDIPEADKKMTKEGLKQELFGEEPWEEEEEEDDDDSNSKSDKEDGDFRPGYIGLGVMEFNKRLRRRGNLTKEEIKQQLKKETPPPDEFKRESSVTDEGGEECITISDDEEVREVSRFAAQPGMGGSEFISKYKSVRALFGEDESCYIMDAKVQGNIGRYLNHSCSPNVFVQNVFVDTHDPRFPWVAFFALSHIKAGTELTWNYNYDVGSVPGKVLYCYCEAPNCRGRLL